MSALGSYVLYYFIVISSSIIAWFSEFFRNRNAAKLSKWIFFSAIIIPVLIAGLRYGIGTDFNNYSDIFHNFFNRYYGFADAVSNSRFEPGWVSLNFLVKYIFNDAQYLFIISALLTWVFGFKAIYDNKDRISVGIAVLILFCTLYNMSFNIVRQVLAVSIIMLAIKPMLEQRKWKYLLIVLFASSFHFTALIFLPSYWVVNSKTGNRGLLKKIIIPLFFIGFVMFFRQIFSLITNIEFLSTYSNYDLGYRGFAKQDFILKLPAIILILINTKKIKINNNLMHKLSILFLIGAILTFLRSYAPYINRVALFFDVTQVFVLSAIVKVQTNKYEKFLYTYIIVIYYLGWFTYYFLLSGRHGTIPYQMI